MAADQPSNSLFFGEIYFVTLDENTDKIIFWIYDEYSGKYLNSETAEFFVCPVFDSAQAPPHDAPLLSNITHPVCPMWPQITVFHGKNYYDQTVRPKFFFLTVM